MSPEDGSEDSLDDASDSLVKQEQLFNAALQDVNTIFEIGLEDLCFAKTPFDWQAVDSSDNDCRLVFAMLNAIVVSIRFILLILAGQKQVALENAALRQQLAVFKRNVPRPKLNEGDRL